MCATPSEVKIHKHTLDTPYPVGPVHIYLLECNGCYALVDTGPPTPSCYTYLREKIPLSRLDYVLVTHSHADHCGASHFIAKNSNARILMPRVDIEKHRNFNNLLPKLKRFFLESGFPAPLVERMAGTLLSFKYQESVPENVLAVEDVKLPDIIHYEGFPGHSISDFVYIVAEKYAITGDFLLNGIFQTPLIEIHPNSLKLFNNYEAYCESIEKSSRLKSLKILPAHGQLDCAEEAIGFYVEKILKRASFMRDCLEKHCNLFQATAQLTDPYSNPFKAYLKASELLFFKSFLQNPYKLKNVLERIGLYERFRTSFESYLK